MLQQIKDGTIQKNQKKNRKIKQINSQYIIKYFQHLFSALLQEKRYINVDV